LHDQEGALENPLDNVEYMLHTAGESVVEQRDIGDEQLAEWPVHMT